jgi:hypothetical protein
MPELLLVLSPVDVPLDALVPPFGVLEHPSSTAVEAIVKPNKHAVLLLMQTSKTLSTRDQE